MSITQSLAKNAVLPFIVSFLLQHFGRNILKNPPKCGLQEMQQVHYIGPAAHPNPTVSRLLSRASMNKWLVYFHICRPLTEEGREEGPQVMIVESLWRGHFCSDFHATAMYTTKKILAHLTSSLAWKKYSNKAFWWVLMEGESLSANFCCIYSYHEMNGAAKIHQSSRRCTYGAMEPSK